MLSSELAQQIASDITDVIGHNVLITDAGGIVLGSGDRSRVGQFHEASIGVARTKTTRSHTAADVASLEGSLPGVTLPLTLDQEVVGTVGLSGPPELVGQFGLIVKRQTEILMTEANRIGIKASRQRAADDLLREVFDLHRTDLDDKAVSRRASSLGYDLDQQRRIVVVRAADAPSSRETGYSATDFPGALIDVVRECFDEPNDVSALLSRSVVAVITAASPHQLHRRCAQLAELATERGLSVSVGVGAAATGARQLNASARDARDALELGERFDPNTRVYDIASLRLPQALQAIPEHVGRRFSAAVLGDALELPDWPELRKTVLAWGQAGFNAKRAAEHMHIHRNTLLYRLQKMERFAGHVAGPDGESIVLYIAAVLDDMTAGRIR